MARVLAIANPAARSGKTSTAVGLATMLVDLGRQVLAVDLDPHSGLSRLLGVDPEALDRSLVDVLLEGTPVLDVMSDSDEGVDLVPATLEMSGAEALLMNRAGREQILQQALAPVGGDYDWIVIDCPSSSGLLSVNALSMADLVIVPVREPSQRALSQLTGSIDDIRKFVNPELQVLGMLPIAVELPPQAELPMLTRIPAPPLARNAYRELARQLIQ